MSAIVYFVYATFDDDKEIPMGVWQGDIRGICSQFKKGGVRSGHFSAFGECRSIRAVERIWAEPEDGSSPKIISENTYDQQDMERLGI
uniref:Uncharacterized protein n=1 Tax=Marseillevirus LCMAC101 TaxID=2506602 RepID=A0A481YSV6_9VIRU|nr:MAG: hypothetical protein LCMAC101_04500 [Marseillevirus LCMAC101]